jgi:hypothetical protein
VTRFAGDTSAEGHRVEGSRRGGGTGRYVVAQPSAAPANDVDQLAGALHGQPARSNEQRINELREPEPGSPGSVIHAIALSFAPLNNRPVSAI